MRSAVLVLLTLHLHAATALLALRLAPPPLHRPVEARPAVARAAGIGCMVEEPEALLVGDNTGRRRGGGVPGSRASRPRVYLQGAQDFSEISILHYD